MPRNLPRLFLSFAILACITPAAQAAEPPRVLTSIKPLHALAAGIMDGVGEPTLLLRATASPHTYSLRPSDARAIAQADVIFWIGPAYESFMVKAARGRAPQARVVAMAELAGMALLPTREGGVWEDHDEGATSDHARGHSHGHSHSHDADETDMHLWLDPANAKAIVRAMADILATRDPVNAQVYGANATRLAGRIDGLDGELKAQLAPVADKPFIVFHDAYQYFERRYGLTAAGAITVTPDRVPGPRRLTELRRAIRDRQAACVFSEPQFTSGLVATVLEGTPARGGILDPLGATAPDGKDGYVGLMRNIADSFTACLSSPS